MEQIIHQLFEGIKHTSFWEFIAVASGIGSVYYSQRENILVYPVGLVSTIIYIVLSANGHLYGEASVNLYYTIMSLYGWVLWARRDQQQQLVVIVCFSNAREWTRHLLFFAAFYVVIFAGLAFLKRYFAPEAIPWADAFASATAYTGMWLMARKKVESWYWWIATNLSSIPLYFVKGYVFTSFYYLILLVMAVSGLISWKNRAERYKLSQQ